MDSKKKHKMICPVCGIEMNHHADKISYSYPLEIDTRLIEMGGVSEEIHSCPECGRTEMRVEE